MIDCGWIGRHLVDYFEGELNDHDRNGLLSHVAQCADCRREYDKYARLYLVMSEDEVGLPSTEVFDQIKESARRAPIDAVQAVLRRAAKILVPALSAAAILLIILWPRNKTVEFSIPLAALMEDKEIALIAVTAVVHEDVAHDLASIEYYLLPETELAIDEMTADEKDEFVSSLHQRYPMGT